MALPVGRISGSLLRALVLGTGASPLRRALALVVRSELEIDSARRLGREARGPVPFDLQPRRARASHARPTRSLPPPPLCTGSRARTARELVEAYRTKTSDPLTVVTRALEAARNLATRSAHHQVFCDRAEDRACSEARASAERWARGEPLGELDGVPIAVKEEMDVEGFATRLGTSFMPFVPAARDAVLVARLRRAGAIVIGQTPMTEYGLSPLGVNAKREMPRNAYDAGRLAGGSSTGSAVAVALGIVPLALGTDGGGSIRVPAAYNGIFGLKPTYGRIPCTGHGMFGGTSVVHFGPLGASTHELAVALEHAAGPDVGDRASHSAPPLEAGQAVAALGRGVEGLRIGVPEAEWADADPAVAAPGRGALVALEQAGATLVPMALSLARHAPAIGYLTIATEARAALRAVEGEHLADLGLDLRVLLSGVDGFVPDDYVDAQRLREHLREVLQAALTDVDVIALPTTRSVAPPVTDAEAETGFIDTRALHGACRFVFAGNLSGLPAASAPVGLDPNELPVGIQILGDAWDEPCVLQVLAELERLEVTRLPPPALAADLLAEA